VTGVQTCALPILAQSTVGVTETTDDLVVGPNKTK
jgi:hypothetical protein